MDQIHGADSSAFLLRCCVRAKTNQLNVIIVEHIIEREDGEVILWFCDQNPLQLIFRCQPNEDVN
jgi:hypothetical protein